MKILSSLLLSVCLLPNFAFADVQCSDRPVNKEELSRRIFSSKGEKNVLIGKADILFRYRMCSKSSGCGEWGAWNVWADKIEVRVDRLEGFEFKLFRIFHDEKWLMADCKDFTEADRCKIKMWSIFNHSMSWVVPFHMYARVTENCFTVSGTQFYMHVQDKEYIETEYSLVQSY